MPACEVCQGTGYILKKHQRSKCDECDGHGSYSLILGKPISAVTKAMNDKKVEIEEKVEDIEDDIEDIEDDIELKEAQIEDLEDEISFLENQITELRRATH